MSIQGKLIEYLDGGKFICAFAVEDTGKRLRVINQNGREMNLPVSRIITHSTASLPMNLPREEMIRRLKDASENRQSLKTSINLEEIWELAAAEAENIFAPAFLTELCFGDNINDDQTAAFLRAIFDDRLFFKYKEGRIITHSPETVEQNRRQQEKEKQQAALLDNGARGLAMLHAGKDPGDWPERENCLNLIRDYYLFGNDFPENKLARELLKKAALTAPHAPYHLLVKAGYWDKHENIPLLRNEIPRDFSDAALAQAESIVVPDIETLLADDRKDFRDLPLLTIDGRNTRDFDDALHLEKQGDNFLVGIHISDVAHYIRPGTPLFQEVLQRGTSIYFPEGPVPMLPETLSEGVCSLKAGELRPAMSFMVQLSPEGEVLGFKVVSSVVTVKRKLSYSESDGLLDSDPELSALALLSLKLRQRRIDNGALLLPFPDVNIHLDSDKNISVHLSEVDTPSRVLVSEFMILANSMGARHLVNQETPGLFRSQPQPRQRLIHGYEKDLHQISRQRKKLSPGNLSATPKAHSGVGVSQYTTLTSPIRRLLDLLMQLQLHYMIRGRGILFSRNELLNFAAVINTTQSRVNAARYLRRRYWILSYLETRAGEKLKGMIIDKGPRRVHLLLTDFMLDADLPANQAIKAQPGETIMVRVARVDALDNVLRVEL